jgi:hypothetical protein
MVAASKAPGGRGVFKARVESGGDGLQELEAVMGRDMPCHARAANSGWCEG